MTIKCGLNVDKYGRSMDNGCTSISQNFPFQKYLAKFHFYGHKEANFRLMQIIPSIILHNFDRIPSNMDNFVALDLASGWHHTVALTGQVHINYMYLDYIYAVCT